MENVTQGFSCLAEKNVTPVVQCTNMSTEGPIIRIDHKDALKVYAFLKINPTVAIPYISMVTIALIVGTLGNVLIIGACTISRQLQSVGSEFILNLALADLFITAVADPLCIVGVTHGHRFFDERPTLCTLIACLCLSSCFCAFFNLGLISLNRYVYICHNKIYDKIFSHKKNLFFCLGTWVLAFLLEMPNFFGFGGHGFDMKNLQCIWMRTASASYTLIVGVLLIAMPLILMTIAYLMIFAAIQKSKRTVYSHAALCWPGAKKRQLKETIKSARSLFIVVIAFLICWTPYVVVILIDLKDRLSLHTHLFVTFLAHLHSSLNCSIYALTNPKFRRASIIFLQLILMGKSSRSTNSSNMIAENSNNIPTAAANALKGVNVIAVAGAPERELNNLTYGNP